MGRGICWAKTRSFRRQDTLFPKRTGQDFKMVKSPMYFVKEFLCVHEIAINYFQE